MKTDYRDSAEHVGLCVVNDGEFYARYAYPMLARRTLAAQCGADFAAGAEFEFLAECAVAYYVGRIAKDVEGYRPAHYKSPDDMAALAAYLQDHYSAWVDPQARPWGGDLIISRPHWDWGGPCTHGAMGVLGGAADESNTGASVCMGAYSVFRGRNSRFDTGRVYVSCSGGPATIHTPIDGAEFAGVFAEQRFWRWKDVPRANGGRDYRLFVPVWYLDLDD